MQAKTKGDLQPRQPQAKAVTTEVGAISAGVAERARILLIFGSERLYNCALGSASCRQVFELTHLMPECQLF